MEPHGAFGCVGAHNHVFVVVLLPSVDELSTPERERERERKTPTVRGVNLIHLAKIDAAVCFLRFTSH